MDVFVELRDGPKSASLYAQLRDAIVSGHLESGLRLPTSRQMANELGVSRHTVTTVYGRLTAEGFIAGRGSAGTFVDYAGPTVEIHEGERPSALTVRNSGVLDASSWSLGGFDTAEPEFDLRTGRPDPTLFPLRAWRRAVDAGLREPPTGYRHPAGLPTVRQAIARWVGRSRGVDADPGQVLVTGGAQQGIDLLARLLLAPGDVVAVEDPGYPPVASLFRALGARVVPVPVDRHGLVVEAIPAEARMVYVTPSHQAPTGVVMGMERRRALLERAERQDVAVIEDDYDTEYRHDDRPLEPLHRLDPAGRVIYVGTFSKVLSPSLRLGFVIVPPGLVDDAIALRSLMDWQPPSAGQHALRTFLADGEFERHLRRTRRVYNARHELVRAHLESLERDGLLTEVLPSAAGLHITAHLASGLSEDEVRAAAARRGVALGNYAQCWRGANPVQGITVGFGATPTASLPAALDRLGASLGEVV